MTANTRCRALHVGLKLAVPMASRFRPYIKGGVNVQDLAGGYGGSNAIVLTTERTPGYEVGAGIDYQLLGNPEPDAAGPVHRPELQAEDSGRDHANERD